MTRTDLLSALGLETIGHLSQCGARRAPFSFGYPANALLPGSRAIGRRAYKGKSSKAICYLRFSFFWDFQNREAKLILLRWSLLSVIIIIQSHNPHYSALSQTNKVVSLLLIMKGNDGHAARKRVMKQLFVVGGLCFCFSAIFFLRSGQSTSSRQLLRDPNSSNTFMLSKLQDKARKFRKDLHESYSNKHDEPEMLEKILEAEIHLVDLEVVEEELLRAHPSSYAGIYGEFCELNFAVHKKDPAAGMHACIYIYTYYTYAYCGR